MKKAPERRNPLQIRDALARLPRFTQSFWTYLTGLTHRQERPRMRWTPERHLLSFLVTLMFAGTLAGWATQVLYRYVIQALA